MMDCYDSGPGGSCQSKNSKTNALYVIVIIWVVLIICACINYACVYVPQTLKILWQNFKIIYGKGYQAKEETYRKRVFEKNLNIIKQNKNYFVNEYGDLTPEEYMWKSSSSFYLPQNHFCRQQTWKAEHIKPLQQFPDNFDYKSLFPKPAYNQGNINSCYAFSGVGVLEAVVYKYALQNGGEHRQFSVQEILDRGFCFGNSGEKGGFMISAFQYIALNGLYQADVYKYCHGNDILVREFNIISYIRSIGPEVPKQQIDRFQCLPTGASDPELMTALMQYGPICVGIFSNWPGFKYYNGTQIITAESAPPGKPDHAVILVGWGFDPILQQNYWIIRNSYGPEWGRKGHGFIQRGGNVLGINDHVSFITLDGHLGDLHRKVESMEEDGPTHPNFNPSIRFMVS